MIKRVFIIVGAAMFLMSCETSSSHDDNTNQIAKEAMESDKSTNLTGTFSEGGKSYSGAVSTQVFPATKEYSVVCQSDEGKTTLMQITFKDEASARTEQTLTIVKGSIMHASAANEVKLDFDLKYQSKDDKPGTVKIIKENGKTVIEFKDVELSDADEKEKKVVSGKIPF